ncbi:hypothetical protein ABW21_db0200162 [Orbilia brochopaga]|nr:hypothetical protein ABW21_db0200162 [Drechslerella brochopaga]
MQSRTPFCPHSSPKEAIHTTCPERCCRQPLVLECAPTPSLSLGRLRWRNSRLKMGKSSSNCGKRKPQRTPQTRLVMLGWIAAGDHAEMLVASPSNSGQTREKRDQPSPLLARSSQDRSSRPAVDLVSFLVHGRDSLVQTLQGRDVAYSTDSAIGENRW